MPEEKNVFIHHVFFWLADPKNEEDRQTLIEGLKKLGKISLIRKYHIGKPADTSRSVIDTTYSISWCIYFANAADQQSYQKDPIHLRFIDDCSYLWSKVLVYDSEDA
jgi:hypothetical protein